MISKVLANGDANDEGRFQPRDVLPFVSAFTKPNRFASKNKKLLHKALQDLARLSFCKQHGPAIADLLKWQNKLGAYTIGSMEVQYLYYLAKKTSVTVGEPPANQSMLQDPAYAHANAKLISALTNDDEEGLKQAMPHLDAFCKNERNNTKTQYER